VQSKDGKSNRLSYEELRKPSRSRNPVVVNLLKVGERFSLVQDKLPRLLWLKRCIEDLDKHFGVVVRLTLERECQRRAKPIDKAIRSADLGLEGVET